MSSIKVRDHLVGTLKADLIGPVDEATPNEVLTRPPASFYLAGFLAPQQQRDVPPDVDDEELDDATVNAKDETGTKEADPKEKRLFPASLGLSVLVPPVSEAKFVTATVSWADYRRQEDAPDPEAPKKKGRKPRSLVRWTRIPRGPVNVELPLDEKKLRLGVDVPDSQGLASADSRGLRLLGELGETHEMPGLPPGTRALSLFLVNDRSPTEEKAREEEQFAFQVDLSLQCEAGFIPRANLLGEKSSDADDRVADLQYRDRKEYAVGHGISVEPANDRAGRVTRVATTHLPRSVVRRVEARQLAGVTVEMDALAKLTDGESLAKALSGIGAAYGDWIAKEKARIPGLSSKERRGTATELLGKAVRAQKRIEAGVEILKRDAAARRAFCLMNEAMAVAARRREGKPDLVPGWRLFQLAFVLLNLEGLCDKSHDDRKTVDLIFFPTGGGKTEAYLGVIGFLLLHRRFTRQKEPDRGLGIAIILRYTLRLLTLDQLGRAATLICALEQMRQRDGELGDVRFSLGLWVGQSATANTLAAASQAISEYKNDDSASAQSPYPLTGCPWCRTPLAKDALEVIGAKTNPTDLRVVCSSPACEYSKGKNPDGIPVLFVDEQIYHELPSFLIATVDKFAMLPWRGETAGFFGRVTSRAGRRFFGPATIGAPKEAMPLPAGLLPPDLIVQDELHLISGPLGTMVGLYETAVEGLCARPSSKGGEVLPKIIASTASVRRAESQCRALYGRSDLALFPPPGLDENESFFACVDYKNEGRTYVGVAAPGRALKGMLLRAYVAMIGAAERAAADDRAAADPYTTVVGYFNSLRELGGMRRLAEDEVRTRALSIEDRRPENVSTHPWVKNRKVSFEPVELTSRRSTAEIAKDKTRLEKEYGSDDHVDICLASNMISVGVDISRLGLMIIAGQPKTTSEYIQSSSRVGRDLKRPGLVVTVLNVNKARDRSHYERFCAYHESFYREVEATSVTPFADPALRRGMVGTLVAMTRLGNAELTAGNAVVKIRDHRKAADAAVARLADRAAVQPLVAGSGHDAREAVIHAGRNIVDAWVALATKDEPRRYSHFEKQTKGKPLLFTVLDDSDDVRDEDEEKFATPTSMRDVEPSTHLWVRQIPAKKEVDDGEG